MDSTTLSSGSCISRARGTTSTILQPRRGSSFSRSDTQAAGGVEVVKP